MEMLLTLGLLFMIGASVLLTSRRIGLPAIPGLIISGMIVSNFYEVGGLSEVLVLGISFLVFYIGLRTDLDGFRKVSSDSLNVSVLQVLITFSLLYSLAVFFGFTVLESLYIALASSIASTLAGTDIFDESLRMDLHHGQISTASNFIQDVIAVIAIAALAAGISAEGLQTGLIAAGILLAAFVFRELFSKKFHNLLGSEELKTVAMVSIFAASLGVAEYLQVSAIAVSFAGGLMFSRGSETEEFLDVLEPLKDFFSIILFTALGALLTTPSAEVVKISGLIILGAVVLRPIIVSLVMLVDGHGARKSFKTSSNMVQVSEFALAAVIIGWMTGDISRPLLEAVVVSTAFTMFLASFTTRHNDLIYEKFGVPLRMVEEFLEFRPGSTELDDHVVVIGYDRRGRKVVEHLQEQNEEFIVVDYNVENTERARIENIEHIFGDVLDDKTLEAANVEDAELVICTSDHRPVIDKVKQLDNKKILMVEDRGEAERLQDENTDVIIESAMIEEGLKQKLKEIIEQKEQN